jgi:hypothetical protein
MIQGTLPEDVIDGHPRGKPCAKKAPLDATLCHVENGVHQQTPLGGLQTEFTGWWEHRFKKGPLDIRDPGLEIGVFHHLSGASAIIKTIPAESIVNSNVEDRLACFAAKTSRKRSRIYTGTNRHLKQTLKDKRKETVSNKPNWVRPHIHSYTSHF